MQPSTLEHASEDTTGRSPLVASNYSLRKPLHCCHMRHAPLPVRPPADDFKRAGINCLTARHPLAAATSRVCSTGQCACWRAG